MDGLLIHAAFDALAWIAAGLAALWLKRNNDKTCAQRPQAS